MVTSKPAALEVRRLTAFLHDQSAAHLERITLHRSLHRAPSDGAQRPHQRRRSDTAPHPPGKTKHLIGAALGIDQRQQAVAVGAIEVARLLHVSLPDDDQIAGRLDLFLDVAQLRDLITTVNSTVVAQEDHGGGTIAPE